MWSISSSGLAKNFPQGCPPPAGAHLNLCKSWLTAASLEGELVLLLKASVGIVVPEVAFVPAAFTELFSRVAAVAAAFAAASCWYTAARDDGCCKAAWRLAGKNGNVLPDEEVLRPPTPASGFPVAAALRLCCAVRAAAAKVLLCCSKCNDCNLMSWWPVVLVGWRRYNWDTPYRHKRALKLFHCW